MGRCTTLRRAFMEVKTFADPAAPLGSKAGSTGVFFVTTIQGEYRKHSPVARTPRNL